MTRIGRMFEGLKRENRKGLIAYLTAGDPSPAHTPALVEALVRGGADLIELGVPFSDPIADGPVIQRAGERALKAGTSLRTVLDIARRIRAASEVPLAVGFGISKSEHVTELGRQVEAVAIGSAIVRVIEEHAGPELEQRLESFIRSLKNGFGAHA